MTARPIGVRPVMRVPASGAVIGDREKSMMHQAVDRGWLTASDLNIEFETFLSRFAGIPYVRTCNSGSSANLLAVAAMVESGLWKRGHEIITVAAGFPTTVNPLLLFGLVPVFVDIELPTYNVNVEQVKRAFSKDRTAGIMLAHTLGNPFDMRAIAELALERNLTVVEDCCDALGATYNGQHVGTMGSVATCSFFPAHHITTGEGGAVFTKDPNMMRILESVRDWGRDCWCPPGINNSCGMRFGHQFDGMPFGYDHKYTFTHLGFNLKMTEIQAACGLAQTESLPSFIKARRRNFAFLSQRLAHLEDKLILPRATEGSEPSWFGFPITLREDGLRNGMQKYLAQNGVDSRLLFGGNLTRQPYMKHRRFLIASELRVTDEVMENGFWIGVWPGLTEEDLDYAAHHIETFLGGF